VKHLENAWGLLGLLAVILAKSAASRLTAEKLEAMMGGGATRMLPELKMNQQTQRIKVPCARPPIDCHVENNKQKDSV